ncbi:hypothetical protein ACP70R_047235 [Stipagrostis hirtigluma subsp. patula]
MAETALSMARTLVGSVVRKAASAAADEMSLLIGVQKDIWYIKDEMRTMQAFLRAAEVQKEKDELLKVWAEQVRELSYDSEDCLDEFKIHVENQSLLSQLLKLRDRHRIAVQIRNLRSRFEEVSKRNTRYNLIKPLPANGTDEQDCYMEDIRNQSAHNIDESGLVGFRIPKAEILRLLDVNADSGPAQTICVVGMGGLGKTTLTRKVYESADIVDKFSLRAWIIVSQSFNRIELLKDMIRQFLGGEALTSFMNEHQGKMQVRDLSNYLTDRMKDKRYFVVLDDVWSIDALDWIKISALPTTNTKGSRIIVTTRDAGIAMKCTFQPQIHNLSPLQLDDAKELLLRKASKTYEDIKKDKAEEIFGMILKKCGGLPLAILTVGGVLATKDAKDWKKLYDQLPGELESNQSLQAMRRVVTLSYTHLPSHLKPCFLYMSIFPEDFEIRRDRLVNRWIAEGFVGTRAGYTSTEVGVSYFNELISRSLVQPSRVDFNGRVKRCRLHDIVRDITISISREENFVFMVGEYSNTTPPENIRHIASSENLKLGFDWSHVRSWTLFCNPIESWWKVSLHLAQFKMLRVLDLEGAEYKVTQKQMNCIVLLYHLKYMRLPNSNDIRYLPSDIGNLRGLQTLELWGTNIGTLPTEITKLQDLRIIRFGISAVYQQFGVNATTACLIGTTCLPCLSVMRLPCLPCVDEPEYSAMFMGELYKLTFSCCTYGYGMKVPKGIDALQKLETLMYVDVTRTGCRAIEGLGKLAQLRKLGVTWRRMSKKKGKKVCESLEKLTSLRSMSLTGYCHTRKRNDDKATCWIHSISSPPPLLESLTVAEYVGPMLQWVCLLTNLVKIRLTWTGIKASDVLTALEALPNLRNLFFWPLPHMEHKMVFCEKAFPKLQILELVRLSALSDVIFEEGTAPLMEEASFIQCKSDIQGLTHLPSLKQVTFGGAAEDSVRRMIQEQVDAHPNHPVLQIR